MLMLVMLMLEGASEMTSSNAYRADSPSAHHLPSSTLPEALSRLSCLCNLCERGNILGAEIDVQDLRKHILIHLSHALGAQGACLLLSHAAQHRFLPVASLGDERLPIAKLLATIDWRAMEQQAWHGSGETLMTLLLDNLCIVLVTLSHNNTLLGVVALVAADKDTLVDERSLLLAFMGRVAALLLHNYDLSHRIRQDAIHQERNRIACELHDGITQQITHVLHKIEYIQRLIGTGYEQPIVSELHHIQSTLNGSLHELRDTMSALLPPRVEKVALAEKIRQLVNEYKKSHLEIELVLKITGLDESEHLPPKLEMSVLLCIQEALTNAWKHAQATSIQIQLHRQAHWLIVEISDNGVGFQPEQISIAFKQHDEKEQHFGLYIMRERIKEAGGLWELQSQPGQGTTVRARFLITNPINELTKRQHEILHLVSEGFTNREIARRLEVSIDTVKTHIHHIMHKLGVKDRVQAVAVAYRNRWL